MKKNILLTIVSIILTFVVLEGVLRLAGALFLWQQEHSHGQVTLQNGEYRILCIGESTTALGGDFSYPKQLEGILNKAETKDHFVVINKGIPSIDTDVIVRSLPSYISQYHPQMIVAMMGINDHAFYAPGGWNNLKVIKLIRMIIEHSRKKFEQKKFENPIQEAAYLETEGEYDKAIEILDRYLSQTNNQNVVGRVLGLWQLAECYKCKGQLDKAVENYEKVLSLAPTHNRAWGDLGDTYLLMGQLDKAQLCLTKQISVEPRETWFYSKLVSTLGQLGKTNEIEPMLQYGLRVNPDSTDILIDLGHFYIEQGRLNQAADALEKVLTLAPGESSAFNTDVIASLKEIYEKTGQSEKMKELLKTHPLGIGSKTQINFEKLKNLAIRNRTALVVMQYPMRSLEPLKRTVGGAPNLLFVDNEHIFKDAVSQGRYADYFIDRFGGDFGHATPKGNYLLASNLASVILNYLSKHP